MMPNDVPWAISRTPSWAQAITAIALVLPLAILVLALTPAFMICPFLSGRHQRLAVRLIVCLRDWAVLLRPEPSAPDVKFVDG